MARNEEKQQGRLNRLWLQKEREEGRLKDVHEKRPKLSTLNSAPSVKKWIPSIKNEIEYYLQQSQLSHYPERKIAEFQLHIEALEKEYKSFITKLRVLDPSCKHKPWTPRAYCKRRAETPDSPGCHKTASLERQGHLSYMETRFQTSVSTNPMSETSEAVCADQNQPLSFDQTRLAVAAAAFRGPSGQLSSSQTQSLARVLQSGLPNLKCKSDCETAERIHEKSSNTNTTEERTGHVLGLDCYSSSDEDCDT
uniref:Si:dkey-86e18.1 n=1 Tax=Lates calcarifer TaxID=8187 RepID=A0A4W6CY68_LATCA